jgi:hypothetical protein
LFDGRTALASKFNNRGDETLADIARSYNVCPCPTGVVAWLE